MIGYVTLGAADLDKSAVFYDAIAKEMGVGRMMEEPGYFIAWGDMNGGPSVGIAKPFNGEPATIGNGVMVALAAKDKDQVHRIYEIALAQGGTCEGEPGPRGEGGFYGAYFRDLDGNKLNAFCMIAPE